MNPYQVLGLSEGADSEQINRAYKSLMAQYSSAEGDYSAQIESLNAAYDALMYSGSVNYAASDTSQSVKFGDVRAKIREKRYEDAQTILDGVPIADRDGEWYFLKGTIFKNRGWLEEATECFAKAVQLEPQNAEFKTAFESVQHKRQGQFREDWRQNTQEGSGCFGSACKLCTALVCCDCLCSLCGR